MVAGESGSQRGPRGAGGVETARAEQLGGFMVDEASIAILAQAVFGVCRRGYDCVAVVFYYGA